MSYRVHPVVQLYILANQNNFILKTHPTYKILIKRKKIQDYHITIRAKEA